MNAPVSIVSGTGLMMIIAFITTYNGLVSLIEGLCAEILYFRFEIIGCLRPHFSLFCFERKIVSKEKAVSPRSHLTSEHILTHVIFSHKYYEYMYAEIWSISGISGPPGV